MVAIVQIGDRKVGVGEPCYIIAEAGVNHNGDITLARKLIDVAVEANAEAVKFQTFKAELVAIPGAPKAGYQMETTDTSESQMDMIKGFELPPEAFQDLQFYCKEQGITFLSTPYDKDSVDLLAHLNVPAFKIASAEIVNTPLIRHIARKGKPIILSTGMSYLSEVETAVRTISNEGNNQIVLLHCVSNYPAPNVDVNLRAMLTLSQAFQVPVGYSDHSGSLEVAIASVALGGTVIEKHYTLDNNMPGPDHRASMNPSELADLVTGIRAVEAALGDSVKAPSNSEQGNRATMRRSLYANRNLQEGTTLQEIDIVALRPAGGISPDSIDQVLGKKLQKPVASGTPIAWSDLA